MLLFYVVFVIVTTVVHTKQLVTRTKHSKYTFVTLLSIVYHKTGLMTLLHQVIASPSEVRFVTNTTISYKLVSS